MKNEEKKEKKPFQNQKPTKDTKKPTRKSTNQIEKCIICFTIAYKNKSTSWWIYFSLLVLIFISGILIIIDPLFLAKILTRIEGASLVINSLITITIA